MKHLKTFSIISILLIYLACLNLMSCSNSKTESNSNNQPSATPQKNTEITGQVFITAQGAENFELGMIQVSAIPENLITPFIASKKNDSEIAQAKKNYDAAEMQVNEEKANSDKIEQEFNTVALQAPGKTTIEKLKQLRDNQIMATDKIKTAQLASIDAYNNLTYLSGSARYFEGIPLGSVSAVTDADGKFSLKIPTTGKYAIAAKSSRKVMDKIEYYCWLFWINANGEPQNITLSNNNMTDSGSPDSLITTQRN